jgi:hypothetical protein
VKRGQLRRAVRADVLHRLLEAATRLADEGQPAAPGCGIGDQGIDQPLEVADIVDVAEPQQLQNLARGKFRFARRCENGVLDEPWRPRGMGRDQFRHARGVDGHGIGDAQRLLIEADDFRGFFFEREVADIEDQLRPGITRPDAGRKPGLRTDIEKQFADHAQAQRGKIDPRHGFRIVGYRIDIAMTRRLPGLRRHAGAQAGAGEMGCQQSLFRIGARCKILRYRRRNQPQRIHRACRQPLMSEAQMPSAFSCFSG